MKFRLFLTLVVIVSLISCIQNDIEEPYKSIIDDHWQSGASYGVYNITDMQYCDSLGDLNNYTPVLYQPTDIIIHQFSADCGGRKFILNTNIAMKNADLEDLEEADKNLYDFLSEGHKEPSEFYGDFSGFEFRYEEDGQLYLPAYGKDSLFIEIRNISDIYDSGISESFKMEFYVKGYFSPINSTEMKEEEYLIRQDIFIPL